MRKVIWPAAYRRRLTSRIPPGGGIERLHQARRRSLSQNKKNQNAAARSGSFSDSKGFRFRRPKAQHFCGFEQAYPDRTRSEEHTSELQSLMRISYAVFCLKKKTQ